MGAPAAATNERLIDIIHYGVFQMSRADHAALKHVPDGQALGDYMTDDELRFFTRALQVCGTMHEEHHSYGFYALANDALDAAIQVQQEMLAYEAETGKAVLTAENDFSLRGLRHPGLPKENME